MTAPLTGFESSEGVDYTGRDAAEVSFLNAVEAASDRMTWSVVGQSVQNRDIRLVRVGNGPVGVMFVGLQHPPEPAGREMILMLLRDLAVTTDETWVDYLASHSVAFLPTAQPDGFVSAGNLNGDLSNRENANGVDINRDHTRLLQPETRAIHLAIRQMRPQIISDNHEFGGTVTSRGELEISWGRSPNRTAETVALADALFDGAVRDTVATAGYTVKNYPLNPLGSDPLRNGRNTGQARHAPTLLVETRRQLDTPQKRIDIQRVSAETLLNYHRVNSSSVAGVVAAARTAAPPVPFALDGKIGVSGYPVTNSLDPLPTGYILTPTQHEQVANQRTLFEWSSIELGDGNFLIRTDQEAWPMLPLLLDPDASHPRVTAIRSFVEFSSSGVNARNGTITAVGGTLTAA